MVQRKSFDKLRIIQVDNQGHDLQTRLGLNPEKPVSPRGTELKKKMMKKSKPVKLSDIGPNTPALRRKSLSRPPILTTEKIVEKSPNYMKATSCFEARKSPARATNNMKLAVRNLTKTVSFKPPRKSASNVVVQRATCSSTLKDSKFPDYLKLNDGGSELEGTSVMKVCPYTYCSLNGHHHKLASLPPLKRFVSAGRSALKTQKSGDGEEGEKKVGLDYFIEIYTETERMDGQVAESLSDGSPRSEIDVDESPERFLEEIGESDSEIEEDSDAEEAKEREDETEGSFPGESGSEMEWEEGEPSVFEIANEAENSSEFDNMSVSNFESSPETENSVFDLLEIDESACSGDEFDESSFIEQLSGDEDQFEDSIVEESEDIAEVFEDHNATEMTEEASELDESLNALEEAEKAEEIENSDLSSQTKEESEEQVEEKIEIMEEKNDRELRPKPPLLHEQESSDEELRNKWSRGKRGIKDSDEDPARDFNPREPNYLAPAINPAGETVDLKHQDMDERKNPGDWMIDRALQEAVTKLGPARKRRVSLLIEAFETVSPITDFELRRPSHHRQHYPSSPVFPHAIRPIQACS